MNIGHAGVYGKLDDIAHAAFAELAKASTDEERDAVRRKMISGEYHAQILALRESVSGKEERETFDALTEYFSECADDMTLIEKWDILA